MVVSCPSPEFYRMKAREHAWYEYLVRGFKDIANIEYSERLTKFAEKFFDKSLMLFEVQGKPIIYDYSDFTGKQTGLPEHSVYYKIQATPRDKTKPIGQTVMDCSIFSQLAELRRIRESQQFDHDIVGVFRTTNLTWRYTATEIVLKRADWKSYCGLHVNNLTEKIPESFKCNRLKYLDYLKLQAKAKLVLVFAGLGGKAAFSWRLTEALAIGCPIVTHEHDTRLPNHKKFQQSVIEVKQDLTDLEEKIDFYLTHDSERETKAKAGKEYFENYLTPTKMAERIIKGVKI